MNTENDGDHKGQSMPKLSSEEVKEMTLKWDEENLKLLDLVAQMQLQQVMEKAKQQVAEGDKIIQALKAEQAALSKQSQELKAGLHEVSDDQAADHYCGQSEENWLNASRHQPVEIEETNLFGDPVLILRDTIAEQTNDKETRSLAELAENIGDSLANTEGGSWTCVTGLKDSFGFKNSEQTSISLTATMGLLKFVVFKVEIASRPSVP